MRTFLTLLLCFLATILRAQEEKLGNKFVFVIPSYNNSEWYKDNLDSVFAQTYDQYRVIYVDDASPDHTGDLVKQYIKKKRQENRVTLIQNETRVGALANLYKAIHLCSPNEIIVNLDGDDWLAHNRVLEQLNQVYNNRNVWLTYGQFIYYPSYEPGLGEQIPQEVIDDNEFRTFTRGTTALRTFYAGLFQHIKKEDLLYNGDFFPVAYDLAIMLPMLEMAGQHTRFMPDVSYVYNIDTPINDFKVRFENQAEIDRFLRKKEKYLPLGHFSHDGPVKKVYITPGLHGELFAIDNPVYNRDNCLDVYYQLRDIARTKGYELYQADDLRALDDDFEYLVVFDVFLEQLPLLERFPKQKLVLFLWEPPSVVPENYKVENHRHFSKVFTWNDPLIDNKKYFKFHIPIYQPLIANPPGFYERRLCTLISCNKGSPFPGELYSERRKVIEFFEIFHPDEFELYGKGWGDLYRTYQGSIDKKVDYLKHYRFNFAYENVRGIRGYVTEKIFDTLQAGTIPIYWGAPNIADYVPKNCFIAREDFADQQALYQFMKAMSPAEFKAYQKNIAEFLNSDKARKFSKEPFIEMFLNLITTPPSK